MAEVKNFLYCEGINVEVGQGGNKSSLIGPLMILRPQFIPGSFSFSIFIAIGESNCEEIHKFRLVFKKTNTTENIIDTNYQPLPQLDNEEVPGNSRGYMLNMDFRNVIIREEGYYESQVWFDDVLLNTYPIYAKAVEENA